MAETTDRVCPRGYERKLACHRASNRLCLDDRGACVYDAKSLAEAEQDGKTPSKDAMLVFRKRQSTKQAGPTE